MEIATIIRQSTPLRTERSSGEKRYNGPANGDDSANAIALDSSGNVVVTGYSTGIGSDADFYTAKYAAGDGALLWEQRSNGPANGSDGGASVKVDGSGNVVVTGSSSDSLFSSDIATIKYVRFDNLTPYEQWKVISVGNLAAPDLGDPEHDGLVNLAEYGLVLSPTAPSLPPAPSLFTYAEGQRLRLSLTRDPARNDITLEVQATGDLMGSWTTIATSTFGAPFTGPGYFGGDAATPGVKIVEVRDTVNVTAAPKRFLRVRVTH